MTTYRMKDGEDIIILARRVTIRENVIALTKDDRKDIFYIRILSLILDI
jgi:hypothetical protein